AIVLHIDHEVVAAEQRRALLTNVVAELGLGHPRGLRLPRQDIAARLFGGLVEHAAGKEYDGSLQNRDEQRQERRRDERKFDGRGTAVAACAAFGAAKRPRESANSTGKKSHRRRPLARDCGRELPRKT